MRIILLQLDASHLRARNCLGGSGFPVCAFPGFKCEPRALRVLGRLERGSYGLRSPAWLRHLRRCSGQAPASSRVDYGAELCAAQILRPTPTFPPWILNVLLLLVFRLLFGYFSFLPALGAGRVERSPGWAGAS